MAGDALTLIIVRADPGNTLHCERVKGEVKAKIKISPVVVFGVLSRMVVVRGS